MADGGQMDVLGQKARAAQRAFEARGMSPAKALRRALSRTADVDWDLALVPQTVQIETLDQDGVVAGLKPADLLILVDGVDGAVGLVVIERDVTTALIEVQTIQQVTQLPVDTERSLTSTDAAMMVPMINGSFERFSEYLGDHPLLHQIEGYRFGAMLEDARSAALILDAAKYHAFRVDVDLALGRRRGKLSFILPERREAARKSSEMSSTQGPGPHEQVFSRVPAVLNATLATLTVPLHRAQSLKPGDLVPLPRTALQHVTLTASKGGPVILGQLGQLNGMRAVRIHLPNANGGVVDAPVSERSEREDSDPSPPQTQPFADEIIEAATTIEGEAGMETDKAVALPAEQEIDFAAEAGDFDLDFSSGEFDFDPSSADALVPAEEGVPLDFEPTSPDGSQGEPTQ